MSQAVPKEARALIAVHIHSVAQLEVLLYMRERQGEVLTVQAVSRAHAIAAEMAIDLLADLAARGFLKASGEGFTYDPKGNLAIQVDSLARSYSVYRVAIINLIFSGPRADVQSFADAFRVRKDDS